MAAVAGGARKALLSYRSSSPSLGSLRSFVSSPTSTSSRLSQTKLPSRISRLPVELGCAQSLMPLHSATASALLTSMLASKLGRWAWLSEGSRHDPACLEELFDSWLNTDWSKASCLLFLIRLDL